MSNKMHRTTSEEPLINDPGVTPVTKTYFLLFERVWPPSLWSIVRKVTEEQHTFGGWCRNWRQWLMMVSMAIETSVSTSHLQVNMVRHKALPSLPPPPALPMVKAFDYLKSIFRFLLSGICSSTLRASPKQCADPDHYAELYRSSWADGTVRSMIKDKNKNTVRATGLN